MAQITKAAEIIAENAEVAEFAGGVPFEEVWVAESRLEVTFPESYKEFLLKFGAGRFGRQLIYGLVPGDSGSVNTLEGEGLSTVWATEAMREADDFFPADLVVIQDTGEGDILCLATGRASDEWEGECPVVQWIPEMSFEEQAFEVISSTFAHFLLKVVRTEL